MDRFEFDSLKLVQTAPFVGRIGRVIFVIIFMFIAILFFPGDRQLRERAP